LQYFLSTKVSLEEMRNMMEKNPFTQDLRYLEKKDEKFFYFLKIEFKIEFFFFIKEES
jgi:hypothetical protein